MRLLVADDHPLFRLGLKAALEAEGLEVVAEAGTGEEALVQALEKAPDAVLLDLRMPGMDGLTCARRLREMGYRGLVILLTTFITTSSKKVTTFFVEETTTTKKSK